MKSFRRARLQRDVTWMFLLFVLTVTAVSPISVSASDNAQTGSVTASAVAVPAQISRMSFMISAPIKEVLVKEGDTVQAGQPLIVLNTPDLEFAVTAADAAYRSAEAYAALQRYKRVKDFRNGKFIWDVVHPEVRQRADALALQAKISMEIAQATLAQNTMIAPYDGTVADINVIPGEFVGQGQAVIALATLNNLQIETTDLNERDVLKVKVGDQASVKIEALNETFPGEVIGISPKADNRGGDIVFKVTIVLDEQPKGLLWGMTAEVTLGE
jgi:RND family efflux transporter MFP subunit